MRLPLLLLVLVCACLPGAVEQLTLADGRVFVGEYDDEAGQLHTTIAGKPFSLAVAEDQIAQREAYRPAKATATAAPGALPIEVPRIVAPEEREARERAAAWGRKVREAEGFAADAAKARRDAAGARGDAAQKTAEAKRHWAAFKLRAQAEGYSVEDKPTDELIVLPRTSGNNRATIEARALSKKSLATAVEYEVAAARLQAQADRTRAEAAKMPHDLP